MLRLRDIMTTDLLAFAPEVSIRDAMEALASRHVSGAPVLAGTKVVGVVSATDLIDFASQLTEDRTERTEIQRLDEEDPDNQWDEGDEPPGTFFHELWGESDSDIADRMAHVGSTGWSVLEEHLVSEVMNPTICALTPETPVEHAASYMKEAGIHRVLIMEGERLVGLVSNTDIARAVAEHRIRAREWVFGARTGFDPRGWPGPARSR